MIIKVEKFEKKKELKDESEKINIMYVTSNKIQYMLRNGYQLIISSDMQKDKCNALLTLKYKDSLENALEVDINCLLTPNSSIKEYLRASYKTTIVLVYNGKENEFQSYAVKEMTEGAYCEHSKYVIVTETKVKSSSFKNCLKKLDDKLLPLRLNNSCNNLKLYYNKETERSVTMEQVQEIPFNYFLLMFNKEIYNRTNKICSLNQEFDDDFYILTEEEKIKVFNDSFYTILVKYLLLTNNQEIIVYPDGPLNLCNLILSDLKDTPYKESLLRSLQFIVVKYLELLGKGYPIISFSDDEDKEKVFKIVYDSKQRMNTFDSINMSLKEQTETMVQVLKFVMANKEVELPNVETDI